MIRHLVLFKLNDGVGRDDPRVVAVFDRLAGLDRVIPELRDWTVGFNVKSGPRAYDAALVGEVDDLDALSRYIQHPEHQALVPALDEVCTRVVVDLEIPSPLDTP